MDHTTCCTYKAVFSRELSNAIWKNDIREIPNFNFSQLYNYFVVITEKYNGDLLRRTSCKRLKSFQFFYEGHIKTMELCTTELFIYVDSKVKPSMKNKFYNVIVKFIRESGDNYWCCLYLSCWIKYQVSQKIQSCWCYSFHFGRF